MGTPLFVCVFIWEIRAFLYEDVSASAQLMKLAISMKWERMPLIYKTTRLTDDTK